MSKSSILTRNERYNRQVDQLLGELGAYSDEQLNKNPAPGAWSAIQTMHHLILSEEFSMAYVKKKLSFNPVLESVGPGTLARSFLLWAYLSTPIKFQAPKNVGSENLPEHVSLRDTAARWQAARAAWTEFLTQMPEEMSGKAIYKHPRAGRLGWMQTLSFFETHFGRHRKQIDRAVKE